MSIFGNIFRGKDLENKKKEFENLKKYYSEKGDSISSGSIVLFGHRKASVRIIQRIKAYVEKLDNCPKDIIKGASKALSYTDNFRETMRWEIEAEQNQNIHAKSNNTPNSISIGIGGIAAGATIATMGPTAAMAIATTFGTASTGAAISSLGGIAATNAALAWLGGGAVAAGGAGMAGGSALLALAGPIGWGLAGVAALGTTIKVRTSNSKAIEEIETVIKELKHKLEILEPKHNRLLRLISITEDLNKKVEDNIDLFLNSSNDYISENYPKETLFETINLCKTLGKLINETIAMEM